MSELKITISQLENLLDRQKDLVSENIVNYIIHWISNPNERPHEKGIFNKQELIDIGQKSQYPHDFNILKRYVK